MIDYYDRDSQPISRGEWIALFEDGDEYRRVAFDRVGNVTVSTVWLGLDHQWGDGPPLIFETLVLGGSLDGEVWRYPTEAEAKAGHARAVETVNGG